MAHIVQSNYFMTKLRIFDSLSEYFHACNTEPLQVKTHCGRAGDPSYAGFEWYGTRSWDEALVLAQRGWKKGVTTIERMAQTMSAELVADVKRPEITFDVTGDMFDMSRVVEGVPECFMTWTEGQDESTKGRVKVVYNVTASAGISTTMIEMRGAAVAALVTVLEAAGRPTHVETVLNINNSHEHRVCVKNAFDPVQIDGLAFALVHTAYFRRFGFAMMGIHGSGHGMPCDTQGDKGDIYLAQALWGNRQWATEADAQKWIRQQLELQGVQFHTS